MIPNINNFTVCATIILSQAYFAKYTPVFAASSSCFACATLYAEVRKKTELMCYSSSCVEIRLICHIHNKKNCANVTKTWC